MRGPRQARQLTQHVAVDHNRSVLCECPGDLIGQWLRTGYKLANDGRDTELSTEWFKKFWETTVKCKRTTRKRQQVLQHVDRVHDAINKFGNDGIIVKGVLIRSRFQSASLKVACEELAKAIPRENRDDRPRPWR